MKPSLPVAIDKARLENKSFGVWPAFTGGSALDVLQQSIIQTLTVSPIRPTYIRAHGEEARQIVKDFVAKASISEER